MAIHFNKKTSLFVALVSLLFFLSGCNHSQIKTADFTPEHTRYAWPSGSFGLPADWSPYEYLILDIEASSPQRFNLGLYTGHGYTEITVLPFQNVRITMPIPLHFYRKPNTEGSEMAALYSRSLETGWFNVWGVKTGPLDKVDSVVFRMEVPLDNPTIKIRSIALSKKRVVGRAIAPTILVDKFGQWIPDRQPGDVRDLNHLRKRWIEDDSLLQVQKSMLERDKYGGYPQKIVKASGFFRKEKIDGKWWLVDPLGHLFLATGINGVSPGDFTRTKNREYIFEKIPPQEFIRKTKSEAPQISLGLWNQYRHYGKEWKEQWKSQAVRRMKAWGFNAINWSVPYLNDTVVYAKFLYGWGIEEGIMGFPDVYSEAFEDKADEVARTQCAPLKDDPWMLGYFLGNEPVFPGEESLVVDAFLKGPETKTRKALVKFLEEGDTPGRRVEFIHEAYRHFLDVAIKAIRRYDPNHLILGMRYGNLNISDDVIKMASTFDVFSFNRYTYTLPVDKLDHIYELLDMPILVGEFHFGVPGRGLAAGLSQVANQHERGVAYRNYVENAFAHPAVVATFWYRWRDQPVTGRNDGENYNIGIVDVTDLMYRNLIKSVMETHQRVYSVHAGEISPFVQMPKGHL